MKHLGNVRLYGAAIAITSGIYAIAVPLAPLFADSGMGMRGDVGMGGWLMALLGVVVLVHGAILLTSLAQRISRASGPLMVLWGALMLGNQLLVGAAMGSQMGDTAWDPGMVALAALMVVSGLIMLRRMPADSM